MFYFEKIDICQIKFRKTQNNKGRIRTELFNRFLFNRASPAEKGHKLPGALNPTVRNQASQKFKKVKFLQLNSSKLNISSIFSHN